MSFQYMESNFKMAMRFALDVQQFSEGQESPKEAIKKAIEDHKENIDKENSEGQMLAFFDGSKATLENGGWRIH